ncbi:MAG: hypothetical protein AB2A00_26885 [Myxococcota bacterium]
MRFQCGAWGLVALLASSTAWADGGPADAALDAGTLDAGATDAAELPDAATPADASAPDAATTPDASVPDATVAPDANIPPANQPPRAIIVATAGEATCGPACAELTAEVRTELTLSASSSSDPEGGALTYLWEVVTRPTGSTAEMTDPTSAQTGFTPEVAGLYQVGLSVQDPQGQSARATLTLDVQSIPFKLDFRIIGDGRQLNCDPRCPNGTILIGSDVVADATGSSHDPAHGELIFEWNLVVPSGSRSFLEKDNNSPGLVRVRPDVDGAYEIRLKLSDARDQAETFASWRILHPLAWKPITCGMDGVRSGPPAALLTWVLVWALARRRRAPRSG